MANSKSNGRDKLSHENDFVDVPCFECGNTINMSVLRAEAMEQTGQDIYCRECSDASDFDEDDVDFIPDFF